MHKLRGAAVRWARATAVAGAASCLLVVAACNEVRYNPMEDPALPSAPPPRALEVPAGALPAPDRDLVADANAPLPGSQLAFGERPGQAEDYKEKADLYWGLNWIKKSTGVGSRPYDLEEILDELKRRARRTLEDANRTAIEECVALYARTLETADIQALVTSLRMDVGRIPWGGGDAGIERVLREEWERTGEARKGVPLPQHLRRTLETIQAFGRMHQAAPHQVERRTLAEAAEKVDLLGYELGLLGKDEPEDRTHVPKVTVP